MWAILCIGPFGLKGQTTISGEIYDGNGGPLTLANSPYIASGITVSENQTLTIEAGVVIYNEGSTIWEIEGTLIAEGEENKRIKFTKATSEP